jgi:hypothetical protein
VRSSDHRSGAWQAQLGRCSCTPNDSVPYKDLTTVGLGQVLVDEVQDLAGPDLELVARLLSHNLMDGPPVRGVFVGGKEG